MSDKVNTDHESPVEVLTDDPVSDRTVSDSSNNNHKSVTNAEQQQPGHEVGESEHHHEAGDKMPVLRDEEKTDSSVQNGTIQEKEGLGIDTNQVLNDEERNTMFEEGLRLDKEGHKEEALKCYLKCLLGLTEGSKFVLLPQCLRNISDIYYSKEEFDKAVSFLQAEKLYYENVLVNDVQIQQQIDGIQESEESGDNMESLRATEYEQLAKLCMDEKQPQLALEYAGKATKIRQQLYGDSHPVTQQSLDFFATVYAEVGKQQYTESLNKYASREKGEEEKTVTEGEATPGSPVSILRRRKNNEGGEKEEKRVRFDESQVHPEQDSNREEQIARTVLWVLFFLCIVTLLILGTYLLCHLSSTEVCQSLKLQLYHGVMRIRYLYHEMSSNDDAKFTRVESD